jgi:hypothetical protein
VISSVHMRLVERGCLLLAGATLGSLVTLAFVNSSSHTTVEIVSDSRSYCANVDRPNPICDGQLP